MIPSYIDPAEDKVGEFRGAPVFADGRSLGIEVEGKYCTLHTCADYQVKPPRPLVQFCPEGESSVRDFPATDAEVAALHEVSKLLWNRRAAIERQERAKKTAEKQERETRLLSLGKFRAVGNTFPAKDRLLAMGGRWDKQEQSWFFQSLPQENIEGVVFLPSAFPKDWWVSESLRGGLKKGRVVLRPLSVKRNRDDFAVVEAQWASQEFDSGDNRWHATTATLLRPLSDAEWAAQSGADAAADALAQERRRTRDEFLNAIKAEAIDAAAAVEVEPGERVNFGHRSQKDFAVLGPTRVYLGFYNGADGDDWSHNNYGGYVVHVAPRTPDTEAAFRAFAAAWA